MLSFSKELPITTEVTQNNNNYDSDGDITPQHADSKRLHSELSQYAPGAVMLQRLSDDVEFHRLVGAIYEAALEPAQMPIALALLSVYAGAEGAHYFVRDKHTGTPRQGASSGWCQHCPQPSHCNSFCHDPQLLSTVPPEETPAADMTLIDMPDMRVVIRLRTRDDDASEVNTIEREIRLQHVLPHLQRAVRMQQRNLKLNKLAALGMAGLDTLDLGVMVIGRTIRVRYVNTWAHTMTTEGDRLSLDGNLLHSTDHTHNAALRSLIEHTTGSLGVQGATGPWMYLARDGRPVPFVAMPPTPSDAIRSVQASPLALVLVGNSKARSVMGAGVLASLFGLTNKECIVVARLIAGETLWEIAEREFLSLHTVRVHIHDILCKTGTHRQSGLVCLLYLLPSAGLERAGTATPAACRQGRLNA